MIICCHIEDYKKPFKMRSSFRNWEAFLKGVVFQPNSVAGCSRWIHQGRTTAFRAKAIMEMEIIVQEVYNLGSQAVCPRLMYPQYFRVR